MKELMKIDVKELKNKQQFLDKFREHCRKVHASTKKKYLSEIKAMLDNPSWDKRYFGFDLLKHIVYGLRRDKDYYKLYDLIKKGLLDDDGRVRNNAVYTIGNYRGFDIFDSPGKYTHMFFDLYESFEKSADDKVKKSIARAIMEINCPIFFDMMEASDRYEDYCNILDKIEEFLGLESDYEIEWVLVNG